MFELLDNGFASTRKENAPEKAIYGQVIKAVFSRPLYNEPNQTHY